MVSPFAIDRRGPTPEQRALVQALAGRLNYRPPGPQWIDALTGSARPAMIGKGQLQRRILDNASFNVRSTKPC